ncbi:Uncharacterized protein Adt_18117 [Abeliophyllum distichum]|uniref:Uncharacterized protein n=1 Tax=Abeliophyllum distichum TaxID=126358 RepID=A0ABD1TIF7_9LAMI
MLSLSRTSCSPQSTLCSVMGGVSATRGPAVALHTAFRVFLRHPGANFKDRATWDLLYAAAEEAARMRMIKVANKFNRACGILVPPRKPGPLTAPLKTPNYGPMFSANQSHLSF